MIYILISMLTIFIGCSTDTVLPSNQFTGIVVVGDNPVASKVSLYEMHESDSAIYNTESDSTGAFQLGDLPDGEYRMVVRQEWLYGEIIDSIKKDASDQFLSVSLSPFKKIPLNVPGSVTSVLWFGDPLPSFTEDRSVLFIDDRIVHCTFHLNSGDSTYSIQDIGDSVIVSAGSDSVVYLDTFDFVAPSENDFVSSDKENVSSISSIVPSSSGGVSFVSSSSVLVSVSDTIQSSQEKVFISSSIGSWDSTDTTVPLSSSSKSIEDEIELPEVPIDTGYPYGLGIRKHDTQGNLEGYWLWKKGTINAPPFVAEQNVVYRFFEDQVLIQRKDTNDVHKELWYWNGIDTLHLDGLDSIPYAGDVHFWGDKIYYKGTLSEASENNVLYPYTVSENSIGQPLTAHPNQVATDSILVSVDQLNVLEYRYGNQTEQSYSEVGTVFNLQAYGSQFAYSYFFGSLYTVTLWDSYGGAYIVDEGIQKSDSGGSPVLSLFKGLLAWEMPVSAQRSEIRMFVDGVVEIIAESDRLQHLITADIEVLWVDEVGNFVRYFDNTVDTLFQEPLDGGSSTPRYIQMVALINGIILYEVIEDSGLSGIYVYEIGSSTEGHKLLDGGLIPSRGTPYSYRPPLF
ncbi:MAG: carboxypeptidase-like regulatory domain-containing protein [Fibrobacterales bacterium]